MDWVSDFPRGRVTGPASAPSVTASPVWRDPERASFAVISYVTPAGTPRASGVVCAAGRHLYLVTAPDSWKARQMSDGDEVAVTVPIRRPGMLSLVTRITSRQRAVSLPEGPWREALGRVALRSNMRRGRSEAQHD